MLCIDVIIPKEIQMQVRKVTFNVNFCIPPFWALNSPEESLA